MLEAAAHYARRGWIVHRIHPPTAKVTSPGKRPLDMGWQNVTSPPTKEKLKEWFGAGESYNIGLLCGEASGVTVIDLDRMIYADIFANVKTLRSTRTPGRGHIFFKYHPRLPASKHHNLGIEVLATGNNVILPPSVHESGDVYRWDDPSVPIAEMPDEIIVKLANLFQREKNLNARIKKCRPCFAKLWKKEVRELTEFHGSTGRELMLAWGADLKAAGATLTDAEMWAKIIYGEDHDMAKTLTEWRNIDPAKTWRCATIAEKLSGVMTCACDTCAYRPRQQAPTTASEKSNVLNALGAALEKKLDTFDIIEALQKETPILYDQTKQFWVWSKDNMMYIPVDETDVLNMLKNVMGIRGGVIGSARATYLQAIKLTGREVVVKEPDKNWVAFQNCVVDIQTGEQFEATPEYMFTNTIPHNYGDSEDTPTLDRLFLEWVGEDYVLLLYEIAAYCLYNGYPIHRAFLMFGSGRNGKGQYTILLQRWLGMTNITSSSLDKLVNSIFQASKLYTKKACFMGETNFGTMNKTDVFKMLTGADLISGERKYGTPFDFYNQAKLIIATNNIPDSDDKTEGFGSRWIIVDFPNKFEEGVPIINTVPTQEYDNLCRKSIRILRELVERGSFTGEGDTTARTKRYEEKSNPIKKFIDEKCCVRGDLEYPAWEFYKYYDMYQDEHHFRKLSYKAVNNWLRVNGYDIVKEKIGSKTWLYIYGLQYDLSRTAETQLKETQALDALSSVGSDNSGFLNRKTVEVLKGKPAEPAEPAEPQNNSQSKSQSDRMKYIDLFFRDHKSKNGEPAEISYASQKQLILFIPEIAKVLHITESVAFKSTMEYGKHRGWI